MIQTRLADTLAPVKKSSCSNSDEHLHLSGFLGIYSRMVGLKPRWFFRCRQKTGNRVFWPLWQHVRQSVLREAGLVEEAIKLAFLSIVLMDGLFLWPRRNTIWRGDWSRKVFDCRTPRRDQGLTSVMTAARGRSYARGYGAAKIGGKASGKLPQYHWQAQFTGINVKAEGAQQANFNLSKCHPEPHHYLHFQWRNCAWCCIYLIG